MLEYSWFLFKLHGSDAHYRGDDGEPIMGLRLEIGDPFYTKLFTQTDSSQKIKRMLERRHGVENIYDIYIIKEKDHLVAAWIPGQLDRNPQNTNIRFKE